MGHKISGSCLCGVIGYQYRGPQYVFQYGHCSRCRKFTGSAHAANLIVDPKNFEWTRGEDQVGRFEHPEAKHFATCFCKKCGSSLPWMSQTGVSVVIPAGTLDDDPGVKPKHNIFWQSRTRWRVEVESLPKYDELPPRKQD